MTKDIQISTKPEKPTADECCGSGWVPCIYDYYYQTLEIWEQKYAALGKQRDSNLELKEK